PTLGTTDATNDTTPVLGGTAEAGSTVRVTVGGATFEVTADASGHWTLDTGSATPAEGSFTLDADGAKTVELASVDAAGNRSTGSGEFTLDTEAPAAPTLGTTNKTSDTTPVLGGTAEAGSTVRVTVGGATYEVTADASGHWTLDTGGATPAQGSFALGDDGAKTVSLSSTDAAGNRSTGSGEFMLDTTAPVLLSIWMGQYGQHNGYSVRDGIVEISLRFSEDLALDTSAGEPTLSVTFQTGTGDSVTRTFGFWNAGSSQVNFRYTVQAGDEDLDGITLPSALSLNGATLRDGAGNDADLNLAGVEVNIGALLVDAKAPDAPTLTSTGLTNAATPVLSGTAEAGSTVRVTVGGASFEVTADAGGHWTLDTGSADPVEGDFALGGDGTKTVELTSTDAAGNASTGSGEFMLDTTAPAAPTLGTTNTTNDATPVLGGTAEAGSTVRVTVGGATFEVTADAGGNWTLDTGSADPVEGTFALGDDGAKTVELVSIDAAGNRSAGSGEFTLDTIAPAAPALTS
ncbi:Ig-like domain-containing protein, partial [Azohydromonas australica]|uniref:Ig-like domain-containing protein n=1 Tax=Azohydromonas australica TaxID=364039 RepID=UPI0005BACCF6